MSAHDDGAAPTPGRYRKVAVAFWNQLSGLSQSEKLLALYCRTGQQANRCGLFRFSPGEAAEDLDTTVDAIREQLEVLCARLGWRFDSDARVLWVPEWLTEAPPENHSVLTGNLKDLVYVPATSLRELFLAHVLASFGPDALTPVKAGARSRVDTGAGAGVVARGTTTGAGAGAGAGAGEEHSATATDLVALWNEVMPCPPFAHVQAITTKRKKHAEARLREHPIETWRHVFTLISQSPFHRGEGDRGWRADFDYVMKGPDVAAKALEGQFDRGANNKRNAPPLRVMPAIDPAAAAQALETRQRRQEMAAAGMTDDEIEAQLDREYEERKAARA